MPADITRPTNPTAYPEQAPGGWTVDRIRQAIDQYERGWLREASRLVRAFPRDPRYVQGRDQFIGAVQGCPMDVLAADVRRGGVGLARSLAEEVPELLGGLEIAVAERWLIEWGKVLNLAVGYLTWDTTVRPWRPVSLTRWPSDAIEVDMYARKLWALRADGGREEIIPGNGTWVVYSPYGLFNWDGLIRCFGEAWIRHINASRDVANRSVGDSVAGIVQTQPSGENDTEEQKKKIDQYIVDLQGLQAGGPAGIIAPPGWELPQKLDLSAQNASKSIDLALNTSKTDVLVPWLMQDGTTTNEGGSLAKVQVLDGVLMSSAASTVNTLWGEVTPDQSILPGVITAQIVRPWVYYRLADPSQIDRVLPLALRRVPDLEEDARLQAQSDRAAKFWAEVETTERMWRRDMTARELEDLATLRGVVLPGGLLKTRGEGGGAPVPPVQADPSTAQENKSIAKIVSETTSSFGMKYGGEAPYDGPFGGWAWPEKRAMPREPHTAQEDAIYKSLRTHFSSNHVGLPEEHVSILVECLEKGWHHTVLKRPKESTLYRGLVLRSKADVATFLGISEEEVKNGKSVMLGRPLEVKNGYSTSWTPNRKMADEFAWPEGRKRGYAVTLIADVESQPTRFLSGPDGLYDVEGLSRWHLEKESVGLEPIEVFSAEWEEISNEFDADEGE